MDRNIFVYFIIMVLPSLAVAVTEDNDVNIYSVEQCISNKKETPIGKAENACFEDGSEVSLIGAKTISVVDNSALKVYQNSTMLLSNQTDFLMTGRSFVAIKGHLRCKDAFVWVASRSEVINHGFMEMHPKSSFQLSAHSSAILDRNSRLTLRNGSKFEAKQYAQIIFSFRVQQVNDNHTEELFLDDNSTFRGAEASLMHIVSGKIAIGKESDLWLDTRTQMFVDGLLDIKATSNLTLHSQAALTIGRNKNEDDGSTQPDSSLIFPGDGMSLILGAQISVHIKKGTHCVLLKSCSMDKSVELDKTSATECFKCFADQKQLFAAARLAAAAVI